MDPLLEVRRLSVSYGGVHAVRDFDLDVGPGEIVGLIGPNGAGKTSLVDGLTGFTAASGSIRLRGRELSPVPAHRRARAGLARTWQSLELFDDLTVAENLTVSLRPAGILRRKGGRSAPLTDPIVRALGRVGLGDIADRFPSELSQGQRKLLGLARALASDPQVLLADEPAAGLDTSESDVLGRRLRDLAGEGLGILLIDHDMGLVLNVCDRVYVIEFGQPLAAGTPADIRQDPSVIAAYLGEQKPSGKETVAP